jgi:8-amino-7-oxononanoate synthase
MTTQVIALNAQAVGPPLKSVPPKEGKVIRMPSANERAFPIRAMAGRVLQTLNRHRYYPDIDEVSGFPGPAEVSVRGDVCVNFSSNDYLGFTRHPKVIEAACAAMHKYGSGSGGSRLTSGTQTMHRRLEERVAEFKNREDAVVFSAGYLANVGIIPALVGAPLRSLISALDADNPISSTCEIFLDELVHSSIIDGLSVATSRIFGNRTRFRFYNHLDVAHLESFLSSSTADNKLIITDGVFSLHGRIAPLAAMVDVARRHQAEVYVDDAHGTGVLGEKGTGTAEHFGVGADIDFPVGTFSKALGGSGGFIAGSADLCAYLRVACRTHVYQTSMPPAQAAALIAALDLIREEPHRRKKLSKDAADVNRELKRLGFDTLGSQTQIIPVRFWSEQNAKRASEMLLARGLFAPCYYYPAVRRDEAMLRVNLMATHSEEQLSQLIDGLEAAGKATGVI